MVSEDGRPHVVDDALDFYAKYETQEILGTGKFLFQRRRFSLGFIHSLKSLTSIRQRKYRPPMYFQNSRLRRVCGENFGFVDADDLRRSARAVGIDVKGGRVFASVSGSPQRLPAGRGFLFRLLHIFGARTLQWR